MKTSTGMTIRGCPDIQSRTAWALIGFSYIVAKRVGLPPVVDPATAGSSTRVKPWMQLCARVAARTLEKVTVEERRTPAGTGIGLVISAIFPKGCHT